MFLTYRSSIHTLDKIDINFVYYILSCETKLHKVKIVMPEIYDFEQKQYDLTKISYLYKLMLGYKSLSTGMRKKTNKINQNQPKGWV